MGESKNSEGRKKNVRAFISYSWDDEEHRDWVRKFADRLREDGVEARLDKWHTGPGDQTPNFMEKEVRESDFVLCVCTPRYKERFDNRIGGVGYEANVMTGEAINSQNQRKYIPILRRGEWVDAAPSWLFGKYNVDLRGYPNNDLNYQDLLMTLRNEREKAPHVKSVNRVIPFVNREIELAMLNPNKLSDTYWQCALISAPAGYGKSHLLKRLIKDIQNIPELKNTWNYRYINLDDCDEIEYITDYITKRVVEKDFTSEIDDDEKKRKITTYIINEMSKGFSSGVLLIIDAVDRMSSAEIEWLSSIIHDVVVGSYVDYEQREVSFTTRVIVSGINSEFFWKNYLVWEESAKERFRLHPPKRLPLSAFDDLVIQELISLTSKQEKINLSSKTISDITNELRFLSGGHPQVVGDLLDELILMRFRQYKEHFKNHRGRLIQKHVSRAAGKILRRFPSIQEKKDVKTICAFRLIDMNTLRRLISEDLISSHARIDFILGLLHENRILTPPNKDKLFYHDDIIRRILYLDLAFGKNGDYEHIQCTHRCAKSLYREWIEKNQDQHVLQYFFVEWLFHALQLDDLENSTIILEWESLISVPMQLLTSPAPLLLDDLKRAIGDKLDSDSEVRYLWRERFGVEDFSPLFDS